MGIQVIVRRQAWAACLAAGMAAHGAAQPAPQRVGAPAADLQGIGADGAAVRLSRFRGRVILLDVSRPDCLVCDVSATAIQRLNRDFAPRGLVAVTCLAGDARGEPVSRAGLEQWTVAHRLTHPVMNDASGSRDGVAERVYARAAGGFPTLALIDRSFRVQYLERGLDITELAARIENLLGP